MLLEGCHLDSEKEAVVMAAAHSSWREPDVARALRTTYRAGLGKMAMGGQSHYKAFVAEQELDGDETIEDDDGDP
eukprot:8443177-Pyramimonas_sp.AAC.1